VSFPRRKLTLLNNAAFWNSLDQSSKPKTKKNQTLRAVLPTCKKIVASKRRSLTTWLVSIPSRSHNPVFTNRNSKAANLHNQQKY
jgi:hypothetical protein